jgi:hypothetical protein
MDCLRHDLFPCACLPFNQHRRRSPSHQPDQPRQFQHRLALPHHLRQPHHNLLPHERLHLASHHPRTRRHRNRSRLPSSRIARHRTLCLSQSVQKLVTPRTTRASIHAPIHGHQLHRRIHHAYLSRKLAHLQIRQPAIHQQGLRLHVLQPGHRLGTARSLMHLPPQPYQRTTQSLPKSRIRTRQHNRPRRRNL